MRYILFRTKRFCGFAVGFVFFVSGLLKLMDPVGSGLVMKEYFKFLHIGFLEPAATGIGMAFAFAETIIGTALVTGVWRKIIAPIAIGLQAFFTTLTLLLVIFKPEMDCGCFGEAIHLTHGETFVKNIIILALLLIYYIPKKYLGETKRKKYVSFGIVSISSAAFALSSFLYIPMMDFTDFRPGAQINKAVETDSFEAVFVYSKEGKEDTFTLDNLPDSTWTFVRTETSEKKAYSAAQSTVSIYDENGEYADSLLTAGKVMVISVYDDISKKETELINGFMENARSAGFIPFVLTSVNTTGLDVPTYNCDHKTLITLNRSNGGATYINNGFIIRKWAKKTLPDHKELTMFYEEDPTDTFIGRDTKTSLAFQGFLLYVFAVMLLL